MNRRQTAISTACLAAALLAQQSLPALALRPPIGAIAGSNKLMQGISNNPDDLSFSPVLLQLAKLVGRIGLSPGFFLQNEGLFSTEPGVDLRTLLLYQAGLIKLPLHVNDSKDTTADKDNSLPSLSFTTIPEPRKPIEEAQTSDLPLVGSEPLPREIERDQVITPKTNVGEPEKISILAFRPDGSARPASAPMVALDVTRLQNDLVEMDKKQHPDSVELTADIPHLAMAMPHTNSMPFITRNMFRLWTWRTGETSNSGKTDELSLDRAGNYSGTFVIATTGAIKSITGRHFTLAPGRLVANNQGGELLFQTNVAGISVEPQATAAVEVVSQNNATTVKVYAIESADQHAVVITLPNGKTKSLKLAAGEAMLISDHPITAAELSGSHIGSLNKLSATIVRGTFMVSQYVQQELMIKSQADKQQVEALTLLKHRVDPR
ncbi:MAG TPA: hypothetical protein V6D22_01515 [Candidatus Obscuribacterales bacterium]